MKCREISGFDLVAGFAFDENQSGAHPAGRRCPRFSPTQIPMHQSRLPCSTGSPDFETIDDPYGSRDEMISASLGSGRARSLASSQAARIQMSVSSFVSNRTGMAFSWIGFTRSLGSVVKNP